MRAVLQRVSKASVQVDGRETGAIGKGWLVLLGVHAGDEAGDLAYLVDKTLHLRAFTDAAGKMNLSVQDVGGSVLAVSQFTLYGDARNGRRPSFSEAAPPEQARAAYERYVEALKAAGLTVATGEFQAHMEVSLTNDGPVTILLDSKKQF